jgi:hypothetical protein
VTALAANLNLRSIQAEEGADALGPGASATDAEIDQQTAGDADTAREIDESWLEDAEVVVPQSNGAP